MQIFWPKFLFHLPTNLIIIIISISRIVHILLNKININHSIERQFPFSALTQSVEFRKGMWPVKHLALVCWWWGYDSSIACLTSPVVTTVSIILSFKKIQNGDILVLTNPGPRGKMAIKMVRDRERDWIQRQAINCNTVPCESVGFDTVLKDCKTLRSHSQLNVFITVILLPTDTIITYYSVSTAAMLDQQLQCWTSTQQIWVKSTVTHRLRMTSGRIPSQHYFCAARKATLCTWASQSFA